MKNRVTSVFHITEGDKEWKQFGPEMFEFKELELLEPADDPTYDPAEDLHVLEALWIEKLIPFGDKGYNKPQHGVSRGSIQSEQP